MPPVDPAPAPAVELPHVPEPFTTRPLDLADDADADAVRDVVRAFDAAYVRHPSDPPEAALEYLRGVVEDGGTAVAVEEPGAGDAGPGGRVVALAALEVSDRAEDGAKDPELFVEVFVRPDRAGRLETDLLGWGLRAARSWLAADGRAAARVETGVEREDEALGAGARDHGFTRERTFWRMERALGAGTAHPPAAPPGVVVRQAQGRADHETAHRLREASFVEHWGHRPRTFDEWWTRLTRSVGADLDQWWLADLDGEPVGFCVGETRGVDGDAGGYVRSLGVLPAARGRGVARHLLRVAFAEHTRRGWAWSQLTVDSENSTGATDLYRSVGMEPVEVIDAYATRVVRG
ncbi:GNAT family N-acetyltransferase [Kineosporia sp. R_H_3]|uniref:GNAT family N-acetyltransferase n=1 Tax=Kineosporia sp. R_H_3 TaxID=1961848 RepID=UPI000B4B1FE0|nr:GNAT family N-acetyltransferase [Kineosporia sp. R_H_3]